MERKLFWQTEQLRQYGNIITGKMFISGDLCIDEYEKYSKKIKKMKNDYYILR